MVSKPAEMLEVLSQLGRASAFACLLVTRYPDPQTKATTITPPTTVHRIHCLSRSVIILSTLLSKITLERN